MFPEKKVEGQKQNIVNGLKARFEETKEPGSQSSDKNIVPLRNKKNLSSVNENCIPSSSSSSIANRVSMAALNGLNRVRMSPIVSELNEKLSQCQAQLKQKEEEKKLKQEEEDAKSSVIATDSSHEVDNKLTVDIDVTETDPLPKLDREQVIVEGKKVIMEVLQDLNAGNSDNLLDCASKLDETVNNFRKVGAPPPPPPLFLKASSIASLPTRKKNTATQEGSTKLEELENVMKNLEEDAASLPRSSPR